MPRRLDPRMTFDALEDEILFTTAAVKADPDAADLAEMTSEWLGMVDEARSADRAVRQDAAAVDAARAVANGRLDRALVAFGDELWLAVGKERSSRRWRQFFPEAVSRFVRQSLPREVMAVKGWLGGARDDVLERHRKEIEPWATRAEEALGRGRAVGARRGEVWQEREEVADALTRERDGLHDVLSGRARERKLAREWPDLFFRVEPRPEPAPASPPAPPAPGAPSPPEP